MRSGPDYLPIGVSSNALQQSVRALLKGTGQHEIGSHAWRQMVAALLALAGVYCSSSYVGDVGPANSRPVCTQPPPLRGTSPSQCSYCGRAMAITNTSPPCWSNFGHQHSSAWTRVQALKHHPSHSTTTTPMNPDTWSPPIVKTGTCWVPLEHLVKHTVAGAPRQSAIRPCVQLRVPATLRAKRAVWVPVTLRPICHLQQALRPVRPPRAPSTLLCGDWQWPSAPEAPREHIRKIVTMPVIVSVTTV